MTKYRVKGKSNIPLGMIDVLYSRSYSPQQNPSYWPKFLADLRNFGKLSPQEMAAQIGIKPKQRVKESGLPVMCS